MTCVMASSSITTVGGLVIVTQVIPQDETALPLQTAGTCQQAPPQSAWTPTPPSPNKMDDMAATYLQGEPQGLGVVQIVIGLLCILFSLTALISQFLMVHAVFGGAVIFVVSGSLTVAARRRTSATLVWMSLMSNAISVLLSLGGVACLCWLLSAGLPSQQYCSRTFGYIVTDNQLTSCSQKLRVLNVVLFGLRSLFLVLLVLQVCVAVAGCVFAGKAVRRHDRYAPIMVADGDEDMLVSAGASLLGSDVALLGSDGKETSTAAPKSP